MKNVKKKKIKISISIVQTPQSHVCRYFCYLHVITKCLQKRLEKYYTIVKHTRTHLRNFNNIQECHHLRVVVSRQINHSFMKKVTFRLWYVRLIKQINVPVQMITRTRLRDYGLFYIVLSWSLRHYF